MNPHGSAGRTRTYNALINSQVLCQIELQQNMVEAERVELPSHAPKARVLPLHYASFGLLYHRNSEYSSWRGQPRRI